MNRPDLELLTLEVKNRIKNSMPMPYVSISDYDFANNIKHSIEGAISNALHELRDEIIDAVVDELYSDDMFEKSLGLK